MEDMLEEFNEENLMLNHEALAKRIKRSLYYDPIKNPDKDTLSFSVTKFAVEGFRSAAPSPIRQLGHRYAAKVAREACVSPCSLLLGVIYIERLKSRNPEYLQNISSSDLFLVSMMVASKYLYDEGVDEEVFNDEWANSGGLKISEINFLEMEFLRAVDWKIYVNPKEFNEVLSKAEASVAKINGLKRGWMTYTDLKSLLDYYEVAQNIALATKYLYHVSSLCLLAYGGFLLATGASLFALTNLMKSPVATYSTLKYEMQNRVCLDPAPKQELSSEMSQDEVDENCDEDVEIDENEITKLEEEITQKLFFKQIDNHEIFFPSNLSCLSQLTPRYKIKDKCLECAKKSLTTKTINKWNADQKHAKVFCKGCVIKKTNPQHRKFPTALQNFGMTLKLCKNVNPILFFIELNSLNLLCTTTLPKIKNMSQY